MKKRTIFLSICTAIVILVCSVIAAFPVGANTVATQSFTVSDLRNLQDFLLNRETEDLSGKDYDLNDDDVWNVFDLCLMRQTFVQSHNTESKTLVAYYSASGTTDRIAGFIAEELDADIFVITPVDEYTSADLNWTDSTSRVVTEHNDPDRHTELVTITPENFDSYDNVFIGYPIWWQEAAWVVNDFVTENDFTGKNVIPFCTSMSSPLGESGTKLAEMAGTGNWLGGMRFTSRSTQEQVQEWVNSLDLTKPNPEIVRTTGGLIQGIDESGIYRFLGVPYATATERFVPAENVEPWDGILQADSYGPMSPQGSSSGTDNNCQNLNIWTPGTGDGEKRAVMVWLHGGGFSTGTANDSSYDSEALSRSGDVVVVSINHRLNVFGHLDLSAYGEKYQYSGNVGITDIIDALEWIQDNIAAFGGDPDNITLFRQSGGGAKILALMTSPYAKGTFDKGIVQSGATDGMDVHFNSKEASVKLTENILAILGISENNIEEIQNVSEQELQAAASQALRQTGQELQIPAALGGGYSMDWEPVIDGDFLPTDPVTEDSFAEAGKDIPLLIGSNLNEWTSYYRPDPVEETEELTMALQEAYPDKPGLTAQQVDSTTIRMPLLRIMSHKADQNGAAVYAYIFSYGNSYHGSEIPYVFAHAGGSAERLTLNEQISGAWIQFAKTGVPSADGLPEWEPYTREGGATMIFDSTSRLAYHHDQALMSILAPDYEY